MNHDPVVLLALRLAARQQRGGFAAKFVEHATPQPAPASASSGPPGVQHAASGVPRQKSDDDWLRLAQSEAWSPTPAQWHHARRQAQALKALGITMVPVWSLPPHFWAARPVPAALFVRGAVHLLQRRAIALVGARGASAASEAWTSQVAVHCAAARFLVISGGARGIDAAAHAAALDAQAPTLAYMGCAADCTYPIANKPLFRRILEQGGALVSEHPPQSVGEPWHHAARNRFIATHAEALIVAEAAEKSGTLGTAQWARRLHKPIWVAPPMLGAQRGGIELLLRSGWATTWDGETSLRSKKTQNEPLFAARGLNPATC